jgi:sortase (surface protein transpeptidase)
MQETDACSITLTTKQHHIGTDCVDQIIVHMDGQSYVFEVRESKLVRPDTTAFALQDLEDNSFLTLITCHGYNPLNDTYLFRRVVRAVLVSVVNE